MLTPLQAYKQLCQLEKTLPQTSSIDCKLSPHHDDTNEGKPETVQELANDIRKHVLRIERSVTTHAAGS